MKKRAFKLALTGFPIGVLVGYLITIAISLIFGNGRYYPVNPELSQMVGSELGAVILQSALCGLLGAGFAAASAIWTIEKWSIAKQSAVYFAVTAGVMLPISYVNRWMEHTLTGFLSYFGIFAAIFVVVWLAQYITWKIRLKRLNEQIKR